MNINEMNAALFATAIAASIAIIVLMVFTIKLWRRAKRQEPFVIQSVSSLQLLLRQRAQYIGYLHARLDKHGVVYKDELEFQQDEQDAQFNQLIDKISKEKDDQIDFGLGI